MNLFIFSPPLSTCKYIYTIYFNIQQYLNEITHYLHRVSNIQNNILLCNDRPHTHFKTFSLKQILGPMNNANMRNYKKNCTLPYSHCRCTNIIILVYDFVIVVLVHKLIVYYLFSPTKVLTYIFLVIPIQAKQHVQCGWLKKPDDAEEEKKIVIVWCYEQT